MWCIEDNPLKPLLSKAHTKGQFVFKWYSSVAMFLFLWALLCKRKGGRGDNDGYSSTLIVSLFLSSEYSSFFFRERKQFPWWRCNCLPNWVTPLWSLFHLCDLLALKCKKSFWNASSLCVSGKSLGAFGKLRKATISFVMSVCPSAWSNSASDSTRTDCHKISSQYIFFFSKICREYSSFDKIGQK